MKFRTHYVTVELVSQTKDAAHGLMTRVKPVSFVLHAPEEETEAKVRARAWDHVSKNFQWRGEPEVTVGVAVHVNSPLSDPRWL